MATLHVLCTAIGYIPNLNAVLLGAPEGDDDLARGGIIYEGGKPSCLKGPKVRNRVHSVVTPAWTCQPGDGLRPIGKHPGLAPLAIPAQQG